MTLLSFLDYASVIVFAITGALVASRAQLDLVGFAFIACLTAVGGGTVRDVLLDRNPIFWISQPLDFPTLLPWGGRTIGACNLFHRAPAGKPPAHDHLAR